MFAAIRLYHYINFYRRIDSADLDDYGLITKLILPPPPVFSLVQFFLVKLENYGLLRRWPRELLETLTDMIEDASPLINIDDPYVILYVTRLVTPLFVSYFCLWRDFLNRFLC